MNVIIFGNPDLPEDSLPVRLLQQLKSQSPNTDFLHLDPNEEWQIPDDGAVTVIDTVINLKQPRVFESLDAFQAGPRLTMHDFDAFTNLRLMQKIGKIKSVKIIGLPPDISENEALEFCLNNL